MEAVPRLLALPNRSFFVFGPRGVGKSTWLRQVLPRETPVFDLLRSDVFLDLVRDPVLLEAKVGRRAAGSWVCIDEVQKAPTILDEVHRLIEGRKWRFALSGSSARKLRRGGANLLGGRAVTRALGPFSFAELGRRYDLDRALEFGTLPLVVVNPDSAADTLSSYVHTYLREEIREEGVVRKIDPFLRFLQVAGLLNGQEFSGGNVSRDARVPRSSIDGYFSILEDTLLGTFLPAYRPQVKVRERAHPKFFWFDPGVARAAAGLLRDPVDAAWRGGALETLVLHELRTYNAVAAKERPIAFYRTAAGSEIDFVIETRRRTTSVPPRVVCIEVKAATRWKREWEEPMRSLARTKGITVQRMLGVYRGTEVLTFDRLDVLPVLEFLRQLHAGMIF
ncbi:MAG: ATP-binding protein [Deltaproteobacteria bacterium]|nr:ATP-binding protein [Deltaproteobacteria bacterium]